MTREEAAERLLVVARGVVAGVRDVAELSDAALAYAKACGMRMPCSKCDGTRGTPEWGYELDECEHCKGTGEEPKP